MQCNQRVYPAVGICIPNYNMAETISASINSALKQTYSNFRIYILDNASTDSSWKKIKYFGDTHKNVNIFKNNYPLSMADNWNALLHLAEKEDFINILSADDILEPGYIEECIKLFNKSTQELGYISTERYHIVNGDKVDFTQFYKYSGIIKGNKEWLINIKGFHTAPCQLLINNNALKNVGYLTSKFGFASDMHLTLKLNSRYDVGYIHKPLVGYNLSTGMTAGIHRTRFITALFHELKSDIIINHLPLQQLDISQQELSIHIQEFCAKYCIKKALIAIENKQDKLAKELFLIAVSFTPEISSLTLFQYIIENKDYSPEKIQFYINKELREKTTKRSPYDLPPGSTIIEDY